MIETVEFDLKIHAKQGTMYIPKEIRKALGIYLKAIPNLQGIFVCPKNLPPEQALSSIKTIYEHVKQEVELQKSNRKVIGDSTEEEVPSNEEM